MFAIRNLSILHPKIEFIRIPHGGLCLQLSNLVLLPMIVHCALLVVLLLFEKAQVLASLRLGTLLVRYALDGVA